MSKGEFRFNVLRGRAAAWRGARKQVAAPRRTASGQAASVALPDLAFPGAGLVDALPCGAMVLDENRRIVAVNARLGHLVGLGREFFVIGEPFADFARRAALGGDAGLLALGDLIPADGDTANIVESHIHISSKSPLEARACRADNGQVLITLSAAPPAERRDTDAETARQILENLPGAILRLNIRPNGEIQVLYASPRSPESLGSSMQRLTDPDADFRALIAESDVALLTGAIEAQGPDGGQIDVIFRLAMPDRTTRSVRCVGALSRQADDGRWLDARLIDIEDRMPPAEPHAQEQAPHNSQIRLRDAIESFSDGLALFDAEDRLVLCNRRYGSIWPGIAKVAVPGASFESIVRKYAEAIGLGDGADAFVDDWVRLHRNPPSSRDMQLPSGQWFQVNDRPTDDGGIVVICSDITALKEREDGLRKAGREAVLAKEAAESANRSKSNFLANMSHELRTPLNAVIGFSEIIKGAMLGDDAIDHYRAYAKDIHDSGRHLLELINDILDMSKIEAGKLDLSEEIVDIHDAIQTSFLLVHERAEKSGLTLKIEADDNLPGLRADLRKVKQILINLVGNAVKFTPEGGEVTVSAGIVEDGGFQIEVRDTGIGISEEDLETVVSPFGQADAGLDREYEGTGLGLSLTKALMDLHGGAFEIESRHGTPPTGTTVRIVFPADRVLR